MRNGHAAAPCLNCWSTARVYARGLCGSCYFNLEIRSRFPCRAGGVKSASVGNHYRPQAAEPTNELPGSEGKIRVLEQRVADGRALWHPDDAVADMEDGVDVPVIIQCLKNLSS